MKQDSGWSEEQNQLIDMLLAKTPLIDVRAPVEYAHGAIPGSVNLPLLNDDERSAVGTTYKRKGPEAALELGLHLISGETRRERIATWQNFVTQMPEARIYCFRGGLRSQSVRDVLAKECGIEIPLIEGGYKRVRQFLMDALEALSARTSLAVLTGFTGGGKTIYLRELAKSRKVCDLEGLARHRGSAFGKLVSPQPNQVDFENLLTLSLLQLEKISRETVWIEDESRMIGKVVVPNTLFTNLAQAPLYVLEKPRSERAISLVSEYLTENYGLTDGEENPDVAALARFKNETEYYLELISRRLGGAAHKQILTLFNEAYEEHLKTGSFLPHSPWVDVLLEKYYDPVYLRHLDREKHRVVFTGSAQELDQRLKLS